MAHWIPQTNPGSISNPGERQVALALDCLGDDVTILHSYPWLEPGHRGALTEGEADYVLLLPDFGLLVLEVKGGPVEYIAESGEWQRGGEPLKDPFAQARRNMHVLVDQVRRRQFPRSDDEHLPWHYGYAAVLPDVDGDGPLPPGADPAILLGARELPWLDRRLKDVADHWRGERPRPDLSKEMLGRIRDGLLPGFRLVPRLDRRVDAQDMQLQRLTEMQQQALEGLYDNPRALITGTAGSGKTLLAMTRARRFAGEGKRTLFLCYNRLLAEWLAERVDPELRERLTVTNFHRLCHGFCQRAGIPFEPPPPPAVEFWRDEAPEKLAAALDLLDERWDAVVVDEGQDFHGSWWTPVELLNSEADAGAFYVFADPEQDLYVGSNELPDLAPKYRLSINCRNTRKIAGRCGSILGVNLRTRDDAPEGDEPQVGLLPDEQAHRCAVMKRLQSWTGPQGLNYSRVALLTHHRPERSSLAGLETLGGVPLVSRHDAWERNEGVLVTTVRSFKGLEADGIILFDVKSADHPLCSPADLYVACSRARHLLSVFLREPHPAFDQNEPD